MSAKLSTEVAVHVLEKLAGATGWVIGDMQLPSDAVSDHIDYAIDRLEGALIALRNARGEWHARDEERKIAQEKGAPAVSGELCGRQR
jgi:hypothetical protein